MYDTIIVGGGASGLFAAANIKKGKTLLLEGSKKIGQKILITGKGMCNITNMDDNNTFLSHFANKKQINFLKPSLFNFNTEKNRSYLESKGLELITREDGKVFPKSLKAQSVIDLLHREITLNGTKINYNSKVKTINVTDQFFEVNTGNEQFKCKNLLITTGGKSYPETGSDGSIYKVLEKIGCKIIEPTPALVGVKIVNFPFKELSGNSVKSCGIDFYKDGETKRYLSANGDLLFTHKGVSGPGILNNSRYITANDILTISLISCDNKEIKKEELLQSINEGSNKSTKRFFKDLGLTSSMIDLFIKYLKLDKETPIQSLNKKIKNEIIHNLLYFKLRVSEKIGFNGAIVTSGGVDLAEIDRKTMMSKKIPNLYFAGEVMDIDGDTGGYNLQAAFSTAMIAACDIDKNY